MSTWREKRGRIVKKWDRYNLTYGWRAVDAFTHFALESWNYWKNWIIWCLGQGANSLRNWWFAGDQKLFFLILSGENEKTKIIKSTTDKFVLCFPCLFILSMTLPRIRKKGKTIVPCNVLKLLSMGSFGCLDYKI